MCKVIEIDISKQTFDVGFMKESIWFQFVFENNEKKISEFLKKVEEDEWIVMEASGSYYFRLALFFKRKK